MFKIGRFLMFAFFVAIAPFFVMPTYGVCSSEDCESTEQPEQTGQTEQTGQEGAPQTVEQDEEVKKIKNIISSLGICDSEEVKNAPNDFDSEDSTYSSLQIEHIKLCRNMAEIDGLESELSGNTEELRKNYEDMKANEQSLANRALTAATVAATGIGGMELAQGIAEKKALEDAQKAMSAYISTFRCEYGNGQSVKGDAEKSIELPGGNNTEIMNLRTRYKNLRESLLAKKSALGMKPGIESEEILDKSQMGLYDDEFVGVTGGNEASIYRSQFLKDESGDADRAKIAEMQEKADTRVKAGAAAAVGGVALGIAGNYAINHNVKNRADELLAQRDEIKTRFNSLAEQLVENCNKNITEMKKKLAEIDVSNLPVEDGVDFNDFIQKMNSVELLKDASEIDKIKDIPVCG